MDTQTVGVVHIVDDQPAMLKMVAELVESISAKPRTYGSAREFLDNYLPNRKECLVSDVRMPEIGGLKFLQLVRERGLTLPVIMITGFAEVGTAVEAMKSGAFDYIEKPFSHQAFLEIVQRALSASESLHEQARKQRVVEARLAVLTPTEKRIMKLVMQGLSSREIAEKIGISSRTVDNHRGHLMEKLHVNSTVEMVLAYSDAQSALKNE